MFGYFPTYTLGSLYAAQLAETYAKTRPLEREIESGTFAPLLAWLHEQVYSSGDRIPTEDLITRVTGKGLDSEAFFRHLKTKFD
jgi:carboxypeptidase Taq